MTTELRELMTSAADDQPPHDLAGRAMAGARRRRQGRLAVAGSIAAVTVLVAGAVAFGPMQRTGDEPRPQDVASLPSELPGVDGLPELTAGAMDAASVAYVIDDRLVLVDASDGSGSVYNGISELSEVAASGMSAMPLRPYEVRLSPDGTTALVAMRFDSSQRLLGIRLAVLDVATAEVSVEDLQLTDAYAESAWLEYNLMAWAPDSKRAYCVCVDGDSGAAEPGVWSLTMGDAPLDTFYSQISDLVPSQISAGAAGVMVQLEPMLQPIGGPWSLLTGSDDLTQTRAHADTLAASPDDPSAFALTRDGRYGLGFERPMEKGMMWGPLPAGPVSSIQALGNDFVLVSRPHEAPAGEPAPPTQLYAHLLVKGRDPQLFTTFPAGTTSTSFAAGTGAAP